MRGDGSRLHSGLARSSSPGSPINGVAGAIDALDVLLNLRCNLNHLSVALERPNLVGDNCDRHAHERKTLALTAAVHRFDVAVARIDTVVELIDAAIERGDEVLGE